MKLILLLCGLFLAVLARADDALSIEERLDARSAREGAVTPVPAELLRRFLDRYVGIWEGAYAITTPDGQSMGSLKERHGYKWSTSGPKRLVALSVVFRGETQSETTGALYPYRGRLFMVMDTDDGMTYFAGKIAEDGRSIAWRPVDAEEGSKEGIEERFVVKDNRTVLVSRVREAIAAGEHTVVLELNGEAVRISDQ